MKSKIKKMTPVWSGFVTVVLLMGLACQKDHGNAPPPPDDEKNPPAQLGEEIIETVNEQLAKVDDLGSFTAYLDDFQLSEEDASNGITIFAPVDEAFIDKMADEDGLRKKLPDSTDVEDYIVKGVFKVNDLKDGEKLTTLNGNNLTVSVRNDKITVNGVLINEQLLDSTKVAIFSITGLLKKNPSVMIQVVDGSTWTPEDMRELPAAKATVYLYSSQKDFAAGKPPAYTAQTNADGKAYFREINAGTYYLMAEEEGKSNVLTDVGYRNLLASEGVYVGYIFNSVFASQDEIENAATQPNARPGNFRLVDVNGDGIVNQDDFVPLPYDSVALNQGEQLSAIILIGYSDNMGMRPQEQPDIQEKLMTVYRASADLFLTMTMVDGYLSDDAGSSTYPWVLLDNFTFTSETPIFKEIWDRAYFQIILQLNGIMKDLEDTPGMSGSEKADLSAQAQFLRANCYLQILPYFENILLVNDSVTLTSDVTQVPSQVVYDQIVEDLKSASQKLPAQRSGEESYKPTKTAAEGLLAKAYIQQKDYTNAVSYAQTVINNSGYSLLPDESDAFKTPSNDENIWDISGLSTIIEPFRIFFGRGSYCPSVHLTEMYLIAAEGLLDQSGVQPEVVAYINAFYTRNGKSPALSMNTSVQDAMDILHAIWAQTMVREGGRFLCLRRWEMTMDVLGMKGFNVNREVLPIPQWYMDSFPNLMTNPGY